MPTKGIGFTKRLLNESMFNTLEKQIEREGQVQVDAASTYDYKEGVNVHEYMTYIYKVKPNT